MLNNFWKPLDNYCLINAIFSGNEYDDKIIDLCCIKIVNNQQIDILNTKISPKFTDIAYKDFNIEQRLRNYPPNNYPTMLEIAPKLIKFAKGYYFVGYDTENTLCHVIREGKLDYFKNVIDIRSGFDKQNGIINDFTSDPLENCLKIKEMYEYWKKRYFETYEMPKKRNKC